jgi:hypothetical protein
MRMLPVVVVAALLAGCLAPDAPASGTGGPPSETGRLEVHAVAAPVCPVEKQPPDPACAPRPVAAATVLLSPADGREILLGRGVTDARGIVTFDIGPGDYLVTGMEMAGLMGGRVEAKATVVAGRTASVLLEYDTGIR